MTYIGSGIVTQPFLNNVFTGNGSNRSFSLSIARANVNAIIVAIDTGFIAPSQYSLSGSTLTFATAPANLAIINVRHLGVPAIPFSVANASVGIPQLSATGTPSNMTYLRGDNSWALVTGTVSTISFANPANIAFAVSTPTTTPVISFSNVTTPASQFLRGDGTWIAPSSITNAGGWAVAQSGNKLAFTYNGTLVISFSSTGIITSANNITSFGTP